MASPIRDKRDLQIVTFNLPRAEYDYLRARAQREGRTFSDTLRRVIARGMPPSARPRADAEKNAA